VDVYNVLQRCPVTPSASGLEYPTILTKTLTGLIALDPREDPLA